MRRLALVVAAVLVLSGCAATTRSLRPPVSRPVTHACIAGIRPDPACTPGTTNPAVTPTTIHQTICVTGWTATVRPPVSVTDRIKTERMRAYGVSGQPKSAFELDHLIPLEIGGGTADVANLWPEPYTGTQGARVKDSVENRLRAAVCAGTISLAAAQHAIATDWTTAP